MKKLLAAALVLFLLVSLSLSVSAESDPIEITYWNPFGGETAKMVDRVVESFNEAHPDIHVTSVYVDSENFIAKSTAAVVAGTPPDVAAAIHQRISGIKNDLCALDEYMLNDPEFEYDQFYEVFWDILSVDGEVLSLPYETTNLGIIYNKEILDAAGLSVPTTWEELKEVALLATDVENKQYGLAYWFGTDPFWCQPFLWQNGSEFMTEYDLSVRFDDAATVEAVEYLYSMIENGSVSLTPPENGFLSGKIGISFSGPWEISSLAANATFEWGAAPMPSNKTSATNIGGTTVFMYKTTEERQAASWEFLKYMVSYEGAIEMVNNGWLPIRKDVAESQEWADKLAEYPQLQVFVDQMESGHMRPFGTCYQEVSVMFSNKLNEVFYGVTDAKTAMEQATEEAYAIFADAGIE